MRSLAREFSLGGVILFARNIEAPEQVAELVARRRSSSSADAAALGERRSGGRPRRAARRRRSPSGRRWRCSGGGGDEALARRFAAALAAELRAVGITLDYAPVLDIHTNPKNPVIGDRALSDDADHGGAAGCGHRPTGCRRTASPPAASTFPGTATRRSTRTSSCRSSSIRPIASGGSSACRFARRSARRGLHHDRARAGAVARRGAAGHAVARGSSSDLLRDELGFEGVILSDDLEMKAIAATYSVPDAAVQAIAAGCDGLLICSGDVEVQAVALEALVHAVEDGRIPFKRLEDALKRAARAPRSASSAQPVSAGPSAGRPLRQVLGCDAHRRVADEMARVRVMHQAARRSGPATGLPSSRRPARAHARGARARRGRAAAPRLRAGARRGRLRARDCSRRARRQRAPPTSCAPGPIPSVAALVALRGGYGSVQLLPLLDHLRPAAGARSCSSATATRRRS